MEKYFTGIQTLRDLVIGMPDGLTVPFALAAGPSRAVASSQIAVTPGLAGIAAASIALSPDGYLAARSDVEYCASERAREGSKSSPFPRERSEKSWRSMRHMVPRLWEAHLWSPRYANVRRPGSI